MHFPGFPEDSDWTTALGTFATEQPVWFGAILAFISIAEGESVGHSGDNFRGKSTKDDQGNLNFDYLGLKKSLKPEKYARYQEVELKVRTSLLKSDCVTSNQYLQFSLILLTLFLKIEWTCRYDCHGITFCIQSYSRFRSNHGFVRRSVNYIVGNTFIVAT